jgi:hypothetical protein
MAEASRRRALILGWYLLWIAFFLGSAVFGLHERIIGDELSGAWRTLWAHDWTLHRLRTDGAWPLTATEVAYPRSGPFSSIAPVNDALSLLPQLLVGLVPAYNLVVIFHWLLAATGGYALARAAGARRAGALVGGSVMGWNSFLLTYGIASAVVETSTVGWVAWFFAAMVALVRRPGLGLAIATGLLFAIAGVASFYWALLIALVVPLVAVPALADRWAAAPEGRGRLFGSVLLAVVVAAAAFFPLAMPLLDTYAAQGAVLQDYATRKQELLDPGVMANLAHDYATVQGLLFPGKGQLTAHADMDRLVQSTYAGWVAIALAAAGLRRGALRWLALALAGALLALGPFVFLNPGAWRSAPVFYWVWLRDLIPPVRMITSYVRFDVFASLGLAVLAALGADRLIAAATETLPKPRAPRTLLAFGLSAAVLMEMAFVSPVPFPLPTAPAKIPSVSETLATLPSPGAVLDWPQRYAGLPVEVSRYFFYQSAHHRPIPYDFAPTSYMPGEIEGNAFFAELERVSYGEDYYSNAWGEQTERAALYGLMELREYGFAYLILHPSFVDPERLPLVIDLLDDNLHRVETGADGAVLYRLGYL